MAKGRGGKNAENPKQNEKSEIKDSQDASNKKQQHQKSKTAVTSKRNRGLNKREDQQKHKYHDNNDKPIPQELKQQLMHEVLQAQIYQKESTQQLRACKDNICYVISKDWMYDWQQYVGYSQYSEGREPKGKHFGRRQPGAINTDLLDSNQDLLKWPAEMLESQFLNDVIFRSKCNFNSIQLIDQVMWNYFLMHYNASVEIQRPVFQVNQKPDPDVKLHKLNVIFFNKTLRSQIGQKGEENQLQSVENVQIIIQAENEKTQKIVINQPSSECVPEAILDQKNQVADQPNNDVSIRQEDDKLQMGINENKIEQSDIIENKDNTEKQTQDGQQKIETQIAKVLEDNTELMKKAHDLSKLVNEFIKNNPGKDIPIELLTGQTPKAQQQEIKKPEIAASGYIQQIQVCSNWNIETLVSKLNEYIYLEIEKKLIKIKLWKAHKVVSNELMQKEVESAVINESNLIPAEEIDIEAQKNVLVRDIFKEHYIFLIEIIDEEGEQFSLKENTQFKNIQLSQKEVMGICQHCGLEFQFAAKCLCNNAFYCSNDCKYKDQEFHNQECELVYESESDDQYRKLQMKNPLGKVGLTNIGNTCFMNASFQCLANSPFMKEFFLSNDYQQELKSIQPNDHRITEKFAKLFKKLNSDQFTQVAPSTLKILFSRVYTQFKGSQQHDASEFVTFFLDSINEQLKPLKHISKQKQQEKIIIEKLQEQSKEKEVEQEKEIKQIERNQIEDELKEELIRQGEFLDKWTSNFCSQMTAFGFGGAYKSVLTCPECTYQSVSYDPFSVLPIPILQQPQTQFLEVIIIPFDLLAEPKIIKYQYSDNNKSVKEMQQFIIAQYNSLILEMTNCQQKEIFEDSKEEQELIKESEAENTINFPENQNQNLKILSLDRIMSVMIGKNRMQTVKEEKPVNLVNNFIKNSPEYKLCLMETIEPCDDQTSFFPVRFSCLDQAAKHRKEILTPRFIKISQTDTMASLYNKFVDLLSIIEPESATIFQKFLEKQTENSSDSDEGESSDSDQNEQLQDEKNANDNNKIEDQGMEDQKEEEEEEKQSQAPQTKPISSLKITQNSDIQQLLPFNILLISDQIQKKNQDYCNFCDRTNCDGCYILYNNNQTFHKHIGEFQGQFNLDIVLKQDFETQLEDHLKQIKLPESSNIDSGENSQANCPNLFECFQISTIMEQLSAQNAWYCDPCKKKQEAYQYMQLNFAPNEMIIQLQRFKTNQRGDKEKNYQRVLYPLKNLDISEFAQQLTPIRNSNQIDQPIYDLYGVIIHQGNLNSGHYMAYAIDASGKWFQYDDSRVYQVPMQQVINHPNAYILFYQLIDSLN